MFCFLALLLDVSRSFLHPALIYASLYMYFYLSFDSSLYLNLSDVVVFAIFFVCLYVLYDFIAACLSFLFPFSYIPFSLYFYTVSLSLFLFHSFLPFLLSFHIADITYRMNSPSFYQLTNGLVVPYCWSNVVRFLPPFTNSLMDVSYSVVLQLQWLLGVLQKSCEFVLLYCTTRKKTRKKMQKHPLYILFSTFASLMRHYFLVFHPPSTHVL